MGLGRAFSDSFSLQRVFEKLRLRDGLKLETEILLLPKLKFFFSRLTNHMVYTPVPFAY